MSKIVLKNRPSKTITLPESGLQVEIFASLLAGDVMGVEEKDDVSRGLVLISRMIKSWNLYESNESDKPLEVSIENIKKLTVPDVEFLTKEVGEFAKTVKKN